MVPEEAHVTALRSAYKTLGYVSAAKALTRSPKSFARNRVRRTAIRSLMRSMRRMGL